MFCFFSACFYRLRNTEPQPRRVVSLAHPWHIVREGPCSHSTGVETERPVFSCVLLISRGLRAGRQCRLFPLNSWPRVHL